MLRHSAACALVLAACLPICAQQTQPAAQTPPPAATPESERERWNRVFTMQPPNIRTDANRFLAQVVKELAPGEALDIGMGFGRNALFLARQGWKVTGIDISDVGVRRARQQADAEKLPLTAVRDDMFTYNYGFDRFDLIAFMYMGGGRRMADLITDALKPGGVLVVEHFLRQPDRPIGYDSNELPTLYPRLQVLRYTDADANPDYDQQNKGRVVQFLARKPPNEPGKPPGPLSTPHEGHGASGIRLGTVKFPNTGATAAQDAFVRGLAWLHSFQYFDSREAFREARHIDPKFALAYWGEALGHSQFLWGMEDLPAARDILAQLGPTVEARLGKAGNAGERAFGAAVEAFLAEGEPVDRARAFADKMREYSASAPDDVEAAAFAAHAALFAGRSSPPAEAVKRKEEAIALADRVLAANPDHPGGAHYLIHATDSPRFAARGLAAARAYARIAPDAPHALHMPSHIFLTLGMWEDVVVANQRAWAASRNWVADRRRPVAELDWHALQWLQYAYLQLGRFGDARAIIDNARTTLEPIAPDAVAAGSLTPFVIPALAFQYGLDTGQWDAFPAGAPPSGGGAPASAAADVRRPMAAYQAGVAAVRGRRDIAGGVAAVSRLRAEEKLQSAGRLTPLLERLIVQLEGFIAEARGDRDAAIASFTTVAESEAAEDPALAPANPPGMVPPWEALGAALLDARRARDAVTAYQRALERRPNRSAALLGLARAKAAAQDRAGAAETFGRLLANLKLADPDVPALVEARKAIDGVRPR